MIAVIGLDGATWPYIEEHLGDLPTFKYLVDRYQAGRLECDVRPIGSVSSWTTAFTGLPVEEHGLTLFLERDEVPPDLPWVWRGISDAIVLALPVCKPPLCAKARLPEWRDIVWPNSLPLIAESTRFLAQKSIKFLRQKPQLFIVVFPAIDRVAHHWIGNDHEMKGHHIRIDTALKEMLPYFEDGPFLIMSDHGMCPLSEMVEKGWGGLNPKMNPSGGGHSPHGMILGNRRICDRISEVRDVLDMLIVDERLKALGYTV